MRWYVDGWTAITYAGRLALLKTPKVAFLWFARKTWLLLLVIRLLGLFLRVPRPHRRHWIAGAVLKLPYGLCRSLVA